MDMYLDTTIGQLTKIIRTY